MSYDTLYDALNDVSNLPNEDLELIAELVALNARTVVSFGRQRYQVVYLEGYLFDQWIGLYDLRPES